MVHFIQNATKFSALYLLVFIGLWLIGYGAARCFLPRSLKSYSGFLAPVWGMALIIAVLTPLSLLGMPLKYANWLVYFISLALALSINSEHENRDSAVPFAWQQIALIVAVLALTAIGGSIVLFTSPNAAYDSVRGSTDFFAYWTVPDYANQFGGRLDDYLHQKVFLHSEIYAHITYWERWGTMVFLGFFSSVISGENIYLLINPIILVGKAALILFFVSVALKSRVSAYPIVMLLSATALTYSNLYFTYFSYAIALPIAALTAWSIEAALLDSERPHWRTPAGIGILLGVSLVSHSVAFVALCFVVAFITVIHLYKNRHRLIDIFWASHRSIAIVVILTMPYGIVYGKRVANAVINSGKQSQMGWVWERLPMPQDILGLGNTLGFNELGPKFPFIIQMMLAFVIVTLFFYGIRKVYGGVVFVAFTLFSLISLQRFFFEYYVEKNSIASHSIAKLIFSFSDFLVFAIAIGGWETSRKISHRPFRILLISGWITATIGFLFYTTELPAFYEKSLISLLRSNQSDAHFYVSTPAFKEFGQEYRFGPILRNGDKFVSGAEQLRSSAYCNKPLLFAWTGNENFHGEVIASRGKYSLGLPPYLLDFTNSPGDISLLSGFNYWENTYRWVEKSASLVLKAADLGTSAPKNYKLKIAAIGINETLHKIHKELGSTMQMEATINGAIKIPFELHDGENDISIVLPEGSLETCNSYTLIEFNAPFEVSGIDFGTQDTKKTSWGIRRIELVPALKPSAIRSSIALPFAAKDLKPNGNCGLDEISWQSDSEESEKTANTKIVKLAGWSANVADGFMSKILLLELDGHDKFYVDAFRGPQRPDVAAAFKQPSLVASGWESLFDASAIPPGNYNVKVIQTENGIASYCETKRTLKID